MATTLKQQDPRQQEKQPPMNEPEQSPPGFASKMEIKSDYGEQAYKGSGKLKGRKALITGADSGIGRAVALAFAREGADVLIAYLNEDKDARETQRLVEESGCKAQCVRGDIGQEAHCQRLVETAIESFGGLDILVNNAAYQMTYPSIQEITTAELDRTFHTNVYALFYLCKAALQHMKPGSAIINTSSIEAFQPDSHLLAYAATKAAIHNFTKSFAQEAIKKGVRVNAVAPGPIWTPLIPSTMPHEQVEKFGEDSLMKRPGQPAELAPVYVFLASQEASYVTAQTYGVTGGSPLV